jgi:hypothetical protein
LRSRFGSNKSESIFPFVLRSKIIATPGWLIHVKDDKSASISSITSGRDIVVSEDVVGRIHISMTSKGFQPISTSWMRAIDSSDREGLLLVLSGNWYLDNARYGNKEDRTYFCFRGPQLPTDA